MKWLIDTSIISLAMKGRGGLAQRLAAEPRADLLTSCIVLAEGWAGARRLPHASRIHAGWQAIADQWTVLDFDLACANRYAELRHRLESQGAMIGIHDCQIAATALAWRDRHPDEQLTLVTDNEREFARVADLRVVNWLR